MSIEWRRAVRLKKSSLHMMESWRPGAIVLFCLKASPFLSSVPTVNLYKSESKVNWGPVMQQHQKLLCCPLCSDNEYSCDELIKSATFISLCPSSGSSPEENKNCQSSTLNGSWLFLLIFLKPLPPWWCRMIFKASKWRMVFVFIEFGSPAHQLPCLYIYTLMPCIYACVLEKRSFSFLHQTYLPADNRLFCYRFLLCILCLFLTRHVVVQLSLYTELNTVCTEYKRWHYSILYCYSQS